MLLDRALMPLENLQPGQEVLIDIPAGFGEAVEVGGRQMRPARRALVIGGSDPHILAACAILDP